MNTFDKLVALHRDIQATEQELVSRIVGKNKVVKTCDFISTALDEDVLRINIFDGPVHETTTIVSSGVIVKYSGGRVLTASQRSKLLKELGL